MGTVKIVIKQQGAFLFRLSDVSFSMGVPSVCSVSFFSHLVQRCSDYMFVTRLPNSVSESVVSTLWI